MSGRIISLHGDGHAAAQDNLAGYVTGVLEPEEAARFEAHLRTCAECQADLVEERKLVGALRALPADDTESADDGWAALRPRLTTRPGLKERVVRQWRASASWLRWAAAAQAAALIIGGGALIWSLHASAPAYHTLSAKAQPLAGNVVVVFRPDTTESDLRGALRDSHARLVDGPTAADAYVLHVAPAERDKAIADLRQKHIVVLAEPIDGGDAP